MNILRASLSWIRRQWGWLRWPVAFLLLGILFYTNYEPFRQLATRELNWWYLRAALVLCGVSVVLTFLRWYLLVWALDFPFGIRDALRLSFIGYLFNYVAPGATGGDIIKAVMIVREQTSRRSVAAATVLLDRILGLLGLFLVGALASLIRPELLAHPVVRLVVMVLWAGAIVSLLGLGLLLHPAIPQSRWVQKLTELRYVGPTVRDLSQALLLYQSRRGVLIGAVLISLVGHFGVLSCFYLCARALELGNSAPDYWTHIMLIPGAELVGVATPTPGGLGALEGAVQSCYVIANEAAGKPVTGKMAAAAGLFTALAFRALTIVVAAVGAGYYLMARREIDEVFEESAEPAAAQPETPIEVAGEDRQLSGEQLSR